MSMMNIRSFLVAIVLFGMMATAAGASAQSDRQENSADITTPIEPPPLDVDESRLFTELLAHNEVRNATLLGYTEQRTYKVTDTTGKVRAEQSGLGTRTGEPRRGSGSDRPRPLVRPDRAGVGVDDRQSGFRHLLFSPDWTTQRSDADAALRNDSRARNTRIRPDFGDGANSRRDFRGPPLWEHFRHGDARGDLGRSGGTVARRAALRCHRHLLDCILDSDCVQLDFDPGDLARRAGQGEGRGRTCRTAGRQLI